MDKLESFRLSMLATAAMVEYCVVFPSKTLAILTLYMVRAKLIKVSEPIIQIKSQFDLFIIKIIIYRMYQYLLPVFVDAIDKFQYQRL